MSSYSQHLYHIVFRTKSSQKTINQDHANDLYAYFSGILKNKKCHLYRIKGVENHIHILTDINPTILPIDLVRAIKIASSLWMKNSGLLEVFSMNLFSSFRADRTRLRFPPADAGGYSYMALSEPLI